MWNHDFKVTTDVTVVLLSRRESAECFKLETEGAWRALSRMLAGGIGAVLELVSKVLEESTVGRVDCKECASEKVEDFTEVSDTRENSGAVLALSSACGVGDLSPYMGLIDEDVACDVAVLREA